MADFFMICGDILTFLDNWQYFCHFKKGNKILVYEQEK